ncbi:MAG: heparan-alpha-glucosaminide N-acetyltransferase, partial [Notoacmeibacter sp.]
MQKPASIARIDGLDVARGIALLAMASYHFTWDLELFGFLETGTASSGWLKYYARAIASTFLFIVGFSLVLATQTGIKWQPFLVRLAQVGVAALAISAATFYVMPSAWIFFGILHHIVLASIIGLLFARLHWAFSLLAAAMAFCLPYLGLIETEAPWLTFVGLYSEQPNSNDFVPLFPWLAASLAGIAIAKFAGLQNWLTVLATYKTIQTPAR